jgi:hypothetical protein
MIQQNADTYVDEKLGVVSTKFYMINRGNHRKRWGVYVKRARHQELHSRHITLEAAVVEAQTVANRMYLELERRRGKRIPKVKALGEIYVTVDDRTQMMQKLIKAINVSNQTEDSKERRAARKAVGVMQAALDNFKF